MSLSCAEHGHFFLIIVLSTVMKTSSNKQPLFSVTIRMKVTVSIVVNWSF